MSSWLQLEVQVNKESSEAVANFLLEKGSPGISLKEPTTSPLIGDDVINMTSDSSEEGVLITGYFPVDRRDVNLVMSELEDFLKDLANRGINIGKGTFEGNIIKEENWAESWKKHYKPVKVSNSLVITPSWINYQPSSDEIVIEIDPGAAFGTGDHSTTRMCLQALEDVPLKGKIVYDLGCGTGILSIAAAKLGAQRVIAVDSDHLAVKTAKENCQKNMANFQVEFYCGSLPSFFWETEGLPPGDLILANLLTDLIIKVLPEIHKQCNDNGIIVLSGIIQQRLQELKEKIWDEYLFIEEITTEDGWACIRVSK